MPIGRRRRVQRVLRRERRAARIPRPIEFARAGPGEWPQRGWKAGGGGRGGQERARSARTTTTRTTVAAAAATVNGYGGDDSGGRGGDGGGGGGDGDDDGDGDGDRDGAPCWSVAYAVRVSACVRARARLVGGSRCCIQDEVRLETFVDSSGGKGESLHVSNGRPGRGPRPGRVPKCETSSITWRDACRAHRISVADTPREKV